MVISSHSCWHWCSDVGDDREARRFALYRLESAREASRSGIRAAPPIAKSSCRLRTPVDEVGKRRTAAFDGASIDRPDERDHAIGVPMAPSAMRTPISRTGAPECGWGIDDAEECGIAADTDDQRDDRGEGKSGRPPQATDGVPHVEGGSCRRASSQPCSSGRGQGARAAGRWRRCERPPSNRFLASAGGVAVSGSQSGDSFTLEARAEDGLGRHSISPPTELRWRSSRRQTKDSRRSTSAIWPVRSR
jgi:hypothetical protein